MISIPPPERPAASEPRWREKLLAAAEMLEAVPRGQLDLRALLLLQMLLVPVSNPHRGQFRQGHGSIRLDGSRHRELPIAADSRGATELALCDLESAIRSGRALLEPVATANDAVFELNAAHPFADGNGRVARAIGNWILLRAGYELVLDPRLYCRERVRCYYHSLAAREAGDANSWRVFFAGLVASCYRQPIGRAGFAT